MLSHRLHNWITHGRFSSQAGGHSSVKTMSWRRILSTQRERKIGKRREEQLLDRGQSRRGKFNYASAARNWWNETAEVVHLNVNCVSIECCLLMQAAAVDDKEGWHNSSFSGGGRSWETRVYVRVKCAFLLKHYSLLVTTPEWWDFLALLSTQ